MRNRCTLLAVILLLATAIFATSALADAPATFTESFTDTALKGTSQAVDWNPWQGTLSLEKRDTGSKGWPLVSACADGGTLFCLGASEDGLMLQKLDAAGNREWQSPLQVDVGGLGTVMAQDAAGSIYVVWPSSGGSLEQGVYVHSLDAAGQVRWAAPVKVSGDMSDEVRSVTADGYTGGGVVVGWVNATDTELTVHAQVVEATGALHWASPAVVSSVENEGWATMADFAVGANPLGGAVCSWTHGTSWHGWDDLYVQRIDGAGAQVWSVPVLIPEGGVDYPAVVCDAAGNVYVAYDDIWYSGYETVQRSATLVKLSPAGEERWSQPVYSWPDPVVDLWDCGAAAVAPTVGLDEAGNVFVTWNDPDPDAPDRLVQRFNSAGQAQWSEPTRIVNASSGNATGCADVTADGRVVVGYVHESRVRAQQVDSDGVPQWPGGALVSQSSGAADQDQPDSCALPGGDLLVTWRDSRVSMGGVYCQRYTPQGQRVWAADVRLDDGSCEASEPAICVDADGNAMVAWVADTADGPQVWMQRMEEDGTLLWASAFRVDGTQFAEIESLDVAMDPDGHAYVLLGYTDYSYDANMGWTKVSLQRVSPAGQRDWAEDVEIMNEYSSDSSFHTPLAVAVDANGDAMTLAQVPSADGGVVIKVVDAQGTVGISSILLPGEDNWMYGGALATRPAGGAFFVWEAECYLGWDAGYISAIMAQRLNDAGQPVWTEPLTLTDVIDDDGWVDGPLVDVDATGGAAIVWQRVVKNAAGDITDRYNETLRMDANGESTGWAAVRPVQQDDDTPTAESLTVRPSGDAYLLWGISSPTGGSDVIGQRLNTSGARQWSQDLVVAAPDFFHDQAGWAQSLEVDVTGQAILNATLTADQTLNGGTATYALSNDGGATWADVSLGATHTFATTGSDLRWQVNLTADPDWLASPVVEEVRIVYAVEGDDETTVFMPMVIKD